jgi:hypothetical protein
MRCGKLLLRSSFFFLPTQITASSVMDLTLRKTLCCALTMLLCCHRAIASSPAHNSTVRKASLTNTSTFTSQPFSVLPQSGFSSSEPRSTVTKTQSTTQGLGDFIAQGFGLSSAQQTSSSEAAATYGSADSSSASLSLAFLSSNQAIKEPTTTGAQQNASISPAPPLALSSMTASSQGRAMNSSTNQSGYYPIELPTTPPEGFNRTLTLSGDCWNQWDQYWSAQDWSTQTWTYWRSETYWTESSIYIPENHWMSTSTVWSFITTTVHNGRFPITTYSTTAPHPVYVWFTGTPTETWTNTRTEGEIYASVSTGSIASLPSPSCVLPSTVSQCQESWDWWVNEQTASQEVAWAADEPTGCNPSATTMIPSRCRPILSSWSSQESARHSYFTKSYYPPKCSQASVASGYCSSRLSIFLHNGERRGYYFSDDPQTTTMTNGTLETVFRWPSETTIGGPGCTLGCGNCAMQGETVELIYWPPVTSNVNATTHGDTVSPVTVETLGTTFTSPTVRIALSNFVSMLNTNLTSPAGLHFFRYALGQEQLQQDRTHYHKRYRSHHQDRRHVVAVWHRTKWRSTNVSVLQLYRSVPRPDTR